jgi:hypothetical protein
VAAAGLLLPLLVGARAHMRQREAEIEAELQEIVSKARADSRLAR